MKAIPAFAQEFMRSADRIFSVEEFVRSESAISEQVFLEWTKPLGYGYSASIVVNFLPRQNPDIEVQALLRLKSTSMNDWIRASQLWSCDHPSVFVTDNLRNYRGGVLWTSISRLAAAHEPPRSIPTWSGQTSNIDGLATIVAKDCTYFGGRFLSGIRPISPLLDYLLANAEMRYERNAIHANIFDEWIQIACIRLQQGDRDGALLAIRRGCETEAAEAISDRERPEAWRRQMTRFLECKRNRLEMSTSAVIPLDSCGQ